MSQEEESMLTPFIPCSAKLPIIALLQASFFPNYAWCRFRFMLSNCCYSYFPVMKTFFFKGPSSYITELPNYPAYLTEVSCKRRLRGLKILLTGQGYLYHLSYLVFSLIFFTFVWWI